MVTSSEFFTEVTKFKLIDSSVLQSMEDLMTLGLVILGELN